MIFKKTLRIPALDWTKKVRITVARLFQTFLAKVAGKFEKVRPLQKILCKATFQTPFVQRKQKKIQYYCIFFANSEGKI
jgi:hypothetical protein